MSVNGKIRLALLSPKGPLYRYRTGIFRKSLRMAPLTLTTLASLIPDELDVSIQIYDEGIEDIPDNLNVDLVGMTIITGTAPRAYELSAKYRKQGNKVVLGGPHVTLIPEEAIKNADAVVVGYAEEIWPQLLVDFCRGQLKNRYDMDPNLSFQKMGKIAFPKRDLLKKKGYKSINSFEATRGCVHACDFCVVPTAWGKKPFQKPVSHIVDDIKQLGARKFVFYDLNLIADKVYSKELFTALIPLNVKWFGLATTLVSEDPELLDLLVRSGCKGLLIGFESLSDASLADSNKRFNRPEKYGELIQLLHSLGIAINGTFVFGNDSDTTYCFQQVKDFVLTHGVDLPRFSILTPFPNTPLYKHLKDEGRILIQDWSLYDGQHVVFQPKNMTQKELLVGHEKIWSDIYSLKSIHQRTMRQMWDRIYILPLIIAANIGYRYYGKNLSQFYTCTGGFV